MKRVMAWMAAAATLTFAVPTMGGQNDPRLPPLFRALKDAGSAEEAAPVEARIWSLWSTTGDTAVDGLMAVGLAAMQAERYDDALRVFDRMVARQPDFAEGWNKRATVHYLMGDYRKSAADIERTLALEPRHFGALSGLGLVELARGNEHKALEAFERALKIHPHLAGADTHIRALRDKLKGRRI